MHRSLVAIAAASLVALATAACATQTDDSDQDERASSTQENLGASATAKKLQGDWVNKDGAYPRLTLNANGTYTRDTGVRCITTPCPSGDSGNWHLYRSLLGTYFVELSAAGVDDWYRVKMTSNEPSGLDGVWGTTGHFVKPPPPNPCMTVKCTAMTTCQVEDGKASCVPNYPTCASVRCAAPRVCKDNPIVCVKAPCPPTAPSCEFVCPADGWINCMPGPGTRPAACSGEYHTWIQANCPGVGFAY